MVEKIFQFDSFIITNNFTAYNSLRFYNKYLLIFVQQKHFQAGKIAEKAPVVECVFVYIALHFKCQFNKYSLLLCYLLVIFPAGLLEF